MNVTRDTVGLDTYFTAMSESLDPVKGSVIPVWNPRCAPTFWVDKDEDSKQETCPERAEG